MTMQTLSYHWVQLIELWHLKLSPFRNQAFTMDSFRHPPDWTSTDFYKRKMSLCKLIRKVAFEKHAQLLIPREVFHFVFSGLFFWLFLGQPERIPTRSLVRCSANPYIFIVGQRLLGGIVPLFPMRQHPFHYGKFQLFRI